MAVSDSRGRQFEFFRERRWKSLDAVHQSLALRPRPLVLDSNQRHLAHGHPFDRVYTVRPASHRQSHRSRAQHIRRRHHQLPRPMPFPPRRIVTVSFTVSSAAPSQLAVNTQSFPFSLAQGASPGTAQFTISNTGGGPARYSASATTSSGGNWHAEHPATFSPRPGSA
jgi:hypothetical protein